MKRYGRHLALLLVGAAALIAGLWLGSELRQPDEGAGPAAMNFSLPDLQGRTRHLAEWKDKTILLNFWATWCPPCREEIPLLIDVQSRLAPLGLQVVAVAIDEPEAVAAYSQEMKINYPVLIGDATAMNLMSAYGNRAGSLPYSVVIRPDGEIASRKLGAYREAELEGVIKDALSIRSADEK